MHSYWAHSLLLRSAALLAPYYHLPTKGCPKTPILQMFLNNVQKAFDPPPPSFWSFAKKILGGSWCIMENALIFSTFYNPPKMFFFQQIKNFLLFHPSVVTLKENIHFSVHCTQRICWFLWEEAVKKCFLGSCPTIWIKTENFRFI